MTSFKELEKQIMAMLADKLPSTLHYHSPGHTQDVLTAAVRIAKAEGLSEEEIHTVRIAALFHDCGFILGRQQNHEQVSCDLAQEVLKKNNYSDTFIQQVCKMIMATKIPQSPTDKLSEVLCDADLDYLGRDDFSEISNMLYIERKALGAKDNIDEWNIIQVNFFKSHHYFTQTSVKLRSAQKQKHLEQLIALLPRSA